MSLPAAAVLVFFQLSGLAVLILGIRRLAGVFRLRRSSVHLLAKQLPDGVSEDPVWADTQRAVYQRQASFFCPMLKQKRVVTERVRSSRQSQWDPDLRIPVWVSVHPPHAAVVATIRNLYLFPCIYTGIGLLGTVAVPLGALTAGG